MLDGVKLYQRQQYSASSAFFSKALRNYQRFDYVTGMARSYLNLAKSAIAQGKVDNAKTYLVELKQLSDENNFDDMLMHLDIMQSSILIDEDKVDLSTEIINQYIGVKGENTLQISEAIYHAFLTNRVRCAIKSHNDTNEWVDIYQAQLADDINRQARLFRFKAQQASQNNHIELLNDNFNSALNIYREQANPKAVLSTLKEWGNALQDNNDLVNAAKRFESAYKVARSSEDKYGMAVSSDALKLIYKKQNNAESLRRVNQY